MKKMTCQQLGGACDTVFKAETFDEMAKLSKEHAMEMMAKEDPSHLEAMEQMTDLMQDPTAMEEWMERKKQEFEATPEDK